MSAQHSRTSSDRPTIDDLRAEFIERDVRGWLWQWIESRLDAYVRLRIKGRYRESIYSPSGKWDPEGIRDLIREFITSRAIEKQVLKRALLLSEDSAAVEHYLERSFHNFIVDERVASVASNIFGRISAALSEDPGLRRFGGGPSTRARRRAVFGLQHWPADEVRVLPAEMLPRSMEYFPQDVAWREYHSGERQSPGLLNEDLRRIARAVIEGTQHALTAGQLMQLIRRRFDVGIEGVPANIRLGTTDALHPPVDQPSPLEDLVADDLARRSIAALKPMERRILRLWTQRIPAPTVRELAEELGISKSLVNRYQQNIARIFRSLHVTSEDEQEQIVTAVGRILDREIAP